MADDMRGPSARDSWGALRALASGDTLRVWFSEDDGDFADFHARFLRHNAGLERHPVTGEQTLCSSELPERVEPLSVKADVAADALVVRWPGAERDAVYPRAWLAAAAYGRVAPGVVPPPSEVARYEFHAGDRPQDALVLDALERVRRDGLVVVRGGARLPSPEAATEPLIEAFASAGLSVRSTHFGRIEDLRPDNTTNQNTDQLGYTDSPIDLHTDQPFLSDPPRYQLLQGLVAATEGGENAFVDAFAAARYFRAQEELDHELLATTPLRFHRKQREFESVVDAPVLRYGSSDYDDPASFQVRYSYFTLAPHRVPFGRMAALYRAHDRFARLVRDPKHQLTLRLEPGDFVLYDNHRMLHARRPFRGPRWVRGIYFDEVTR